MDPSPLEQLTADQKVRPWAWGEHPDIDLTALSSSQQEIVKKVALELGYKDSRGNWVLFESPTTLQIDGMFDVDQLKQLVRIMEALQ